MSMLPIGIFILLWFYVSIGEFGTNKYGPNPKGGPSQEALQREAADESTAAENWRIRFLKMWGRRVPLLLGSLALLYMLVRFVKWSWVD